MEKNIFESTEQNLHYPDVMDIEPMDLQKKLKSVKIVDVRQPEEFKGELGHIPGATLIVLDTLPEKLKLLPKNEHIVLVCRSGGRSAKATQFLKDQGYTSVYNLKGGMILWNELHLPTEI